MKQYIVHLIDYVIFEIKGIKIFLILSHGLTTQDIQLFWKT